MITYDRIDVGLIKRQQGFRKQLGPMDELSMSIGKDGLKNPIMLNRGFELLSGARRLHIMKYQAEAQYVRVVFVDDLMDVISIMRSERRTWVNLPMKLSELTRQALALEALEAEREMEYKLANLQYAKGRGPKPAGLGSRLERVAQAVDLSTTKLSRMRKLLRTSEDHRSPFRADALRALEVADETGKPFSGAKLLTEAEKASSGLSVSGKYSAYNKTHAKYKAIARKSVEGIWRTLHLLETASTGLAELDTELLRDGSTPKEITEMESSVDYAIGQLKSFQGILDEHTKATERSKA